MQASAALRDEPTQPAQQGISNETFGMLLFLIAECMFFAGLVSAYIVLRKGAAQWHPVGLPPLARGLSISNTVILALSGVSTFFAQRAVKRSDRQGLKQFLAVTLLAGVTFVWIQAYELYRLHEIVPLSGNIFGSVFYCYVGFHAAHIVVGVAWLLRVFLKASRGAYSREHATGLTLFALYWHFVVIVWIFLFFALYVW